MPHRFEIKPLLLGGNHTGRAAVGIPQPVLTATAAHPRCHGRVFGGPLDPLPAGGRNALTATLQREQERTLDGLLRLLLHRGLTTQATTAAIPVRPDDAAPATGAAASNDPVAGPRSGSRLDLLSKLVFASRAHALLWLR
ncbi:hypothetical protein [Streptomyces sp. ISL-86]|uniref:hypothetical protein n=1 Tax=Streptomyces sp. ISL-86 TaxID=2819187 RepID=UPI001BEC5FA1|nr:hypothetical protein [Streptomyces sp. ISL-86]MBT2453313.1 hypothetical protein [Streptomyces sp. ISL-86]